MPMASALPKKRPATYADLLALPQNVVGQIIDGNLVVAPRPAPRHVNATSYLGVSLSVLTAAVGAGPAAAAPRRPWTGTTTRRRTI